jgi:YfiR/HmsC-like
MQVLSAMASWSRLSRLSWLSRWAWWTPWAPGMLLALTGAVPAHGAPTYSAEVVKAAYLYRFTQYVEWPESTPAEAPFTIAVLDAPGVAAELRRLLPNHTIKNATAEVREITRVQDLGNAQMLYIGTAQMDRVREAIAAIVPRPVLVVTDAEHGLSAGSVLNFVMLERRVRFEVSLMAADRSRLRISAELLGVATRVQASERQSGIAKTPANQVGD